jgi:hypothetical protein
LVIFGKLRIIISVCGSVGLILMRCGIKCNDFWCKIKENLGFFGVSGNFFARKWFLVSNFLVHCYIFAILIFKLIASEKIQDFCKFYINVIADQYAGWIKKLHL